MYGIPYDNHTTETHCTVNTFFFVITSYDKLVKLLIAKSRPIQFVDLDQDWTNYVSARDAIINLHGNWNSSTVPFPISRSFSY